MNASVTARLTWAAAALFVVAGEAIACSATDVMDKARESRDTEEYNLARDVASEFIDQEKFAQDELTIEAGAGTLLISTRSVAVVGSTKSLDSWRDYMDRTTTGLHGMRDGKVIEMYSETVSVRDHVRLHVSEADMAIRGTVEDWYSEWAEKNGWQNTSTYLDLLRKYRDNPGLSLAEIMSKSRPTQEEASGGAPPPRPTATPRPLAPSAPASRPIPRPVASPRPAPAAEAVPVLHRAG